MRPPWLRDSVPLVLAVALAGTWTPPSWAARMPLRFRLRAPALGTGVAPRGVRTRGARARVVRLARGVSLGSDTPGAAVLTRAARRHLSPGERLAGVRAAWFRTADGGVQRVVANEFQRDLAAVVRAGGKEIAGVARASFVTDGGRTVHVGRLSARERANHRLVGVGVLAPTLVAANLATQALSSAVKGARQVASPILPPAMDPPPPEDRGVSVRIDGDGPVQVTAPQPESSSQEEPGYRGIEVHIETGPEPRGGAP